MAPHNLSRRDFLKIGATLAAGLAGTSAESLAQGLQRLARGTPRVLWLQGLSCAGCTISWLNAENPTILQTITERLCLAFHPTLSAADGRLALRVIDKVCADSEPFILVVEGAVPSRVPEACQFGGRPLAEVLLPLVRRAQFVVAAGTCASFGGIPAAEGNTTGAASVGDYMAKSAVATKDRLLNCPGCPLHPDELLGILALLASKGYPQVKSTLVPTMMSESNIHNECPRFSQYSQRVFAISFGDGDACLYGLGCQGLDVFAECHRHQWNGKVSWCIDASAPCIGCKLPQFGRRRSLPFYRVG